MGDALAGALQGLGQALVVNARASSRREDRESQDERFRLSYENQLANTEIRLLEMEERRSVNSRAIARDQERKNREEIKLSLEVLSATSDPDATRMILGGLGLNAVSLEVLTRLDDATDAKRDEKDQSDLEVLARRTLVGKLSSMDTDLALNALDQVQLGEMTFTQIIEEVEAREQQQADAAAKAGPPGGPGAGTGTPSEVNARAKAMADFVELRAVKKIGADGRTMVPDVVEGVPKFYTDEHAVQYTQLREDYESAAGINFTPQQLQKIYDERNRILAPPPPDPSRRAKGKARKPAFKRGGSAELVSDTVRAVINAFPDANFPVSGASMAGAPSAFGIPPVGRPAGPPLFGKGSNFEDKLLSGLFGGDPGHERGLLDLLYNKQQAIIDTPFFRALRAKGSSAEEALQEPQSSTETAR